jgi:hypothetical protein
VGARVTAEEEGGVGGESMKRASGIIRVLSVPVQIPFALGFDLLDVAGAFFPASGRPFPVPPSPAQESPFPPLSTFFPIAVRLLGCGANGSTFSFAWSFGVVLDESCRREVLEEDLFVPPLERLERAEEEGWEVESSRKTVKSPTMVRVGRERL